MSYEGETDLLGAGQVIAFLNRAKDFKEGRILSNVASDTSLLAIDAMTPRNLSTPRQALIASESKTNSEKITTLARYVCKRDGTESASIQEIQSAFKKAGEPLPRNFSRDLKDAIAAGYIYESDVNEGYVVTEQGNEAIDLKFKNINGVSKLKRTRSVNSIGKIRDEIKNLAVTSTMSGFVDFNTLSTKGKKILWLIAYAEKEKIQDITPAEIQSLGNKIRVNLPPSSFTALTDKIFKEGLMYKNGGGYRIDQKGLDALKKE